ncbi:MULTISPECIES: DUF4255 domain-containing protein [Cyanophyceae]|uniref:DUF4255 domain-containing protein n=1 Tax=Leptolyngbya subtilissima DQ-A4 TaxID=2933933 RepID=A0ABV0K1U8_9CYAN|nr:DUF4255 domain-containing protein [Nodosilinea sp. FACHB-141]MBD2112572.1 DUF4255 domain-containing protein [Nodosilinea sp. FACHB-141]
MLHDLDLTIEELLKIELPDRFGDSVSTTPIAVTFVTPSPEFIVTLPALNLFLYDIRQNQELRSSSWSVARQSDGTATREPPLVRIDCSYLITMWTSDSKDFATEHQILGEVIQALMNNFTLPPTVLQGRLVGSDLPLRASVLEQAKLQSLGEFWQAMGGKPKATLNYTVTIPMTVNTEIQNLPLVTNFQVSVESND